MADLTVFAHKPNSSARLTGDETREQIYRDAIRRTKEAIVFYNGLKDFARDPASKDTIDKIIKEETHHIRLLDEQLEQK